ncbi:MAG: sulfotransferase domain-containing protein [Chloroflexi bacterium]|nr:sulfotransferase domain-containing protein [Chloroflexota bacterium]
MKTLFSQLHYLFSGPRILIVSLPKAGTHLVSKIMDLTPGIRAAQVHLGHATFAHWAERNPQQPPHIPIGLDWPVYAPPVAVRRALQRIRRGSYGTIHAPYSLPLAELCASREIKAIAIIRDPRDVVVSHARYIVQTPPHFLHNFYQTLSTDEQLMTSITGLHNGHGFPQLQSIAERFAGILEWRAQDFVCFCSFEKLVGERGGGSEVEQRVEITKVLQHLELDSSPQTARAIAQNLFGGTQTFRKGQIGSWKQHFTPAHKAAFKRLMDPIPIETGYVQDSDW